MPMAELVVAGGTVVTEAGSRPADVVVTGGRIATLTEPGAGRADRRVDATGLWVLPGMVDIHVHLRDPGLTHKETFATGTAAAARGGITAVADMPNTVPPLLTADDFAAKRAHAEGAAHVDFGLWAGATRPEEFSAFAAAGAVGVKVFLAGPEQGDQYRDDLGVGDDGQLLEIMDAARRAGLPVAVHLANPAIERTWRRSWRGRALPDLRAEICSESRLDKVEAAQRVLLLAGHTGARLHLVHVSAAVLPLVARAKRDGLAVTAESFAPFVSTDDFGRLGVRGYDRYRRPDEITQLWEALVTGAVDNLASDHAPHTWAEKAAGDTDVSACPSGYPELDTIVPMLLHEVLEGRLRPETLVRRYAAAPARIAGWAGRKGAIEPGRDADLVLFDPTASWTVSAADCRSKAGWSPFEGRRLRGRVRRVLLRGIDVTSAAAPPGTHLPSRRGDWT